MEPDILEKASKECLCSFIEGALGEIASRDPRLGEDVEEMLYVAVNGMHFTPWSYKEAISEMGGCHWDIDSIREIMSEEGISSDSFNEYDFAYVMNMLYDDCSEAIGEDCRKFAKMALGFLTGKHAKEGKAWLYWKKMA